MTLIELLMTVTIMGIVMTALMATLFATVANSRLNRDSATLEAETRRYADKVVAADYVTCATTAQYYNAITTGESLPDGVDVYVDDVAFWNGLSLVTPNYVTHAVECGDGSDKELQRVTVRVEVGGMSRTEIVIKRRFG